MITDYQILGVSENASIIDIKKAYRLKVKELHPDVSDAQKNVNNHFLFVEVCKAYERLCKTTENTELTTSPQESSNSSCKELISHKDSAYVYYKKGCGYFEKIHPSHWNNNQTITINGKTKSENHLQKETLEKVKELVNLFPKAYYCFSIVVHEYPQSVWTSDSKEKMNIIEKRMKRYQSIIESFITWNKSEPLIKNGKEMYKNFSKEYLENSK